MKLWTEILTEDFCVTHVGDVEVVVPMSDVTSRQVRNVKTQLESRRGFKSSLQELRETAKTIENDIAFHEWLRENNIDLRTNVTTDTNW